MEQEVELCRLDYRRLADFEESNLKFVAVLRQRDGLGLELRTEGMLLRRADEHRCATAFSETMSMKSGRAFRESQAGKVSEAQQAPRRSGLFRLKAIGVGADRKLSPVWLRFGSAPTLAAKYL
jgi:hypothetical protein